MVDMTRAWRILDNEISMTPVPEEYSNFYVKVDFVTECCLFCFSYFFFFYMGHCHGSLEVIRSSLVENETWYLIKRQRCPLQTKTQTPNEFCQERVYVLKCRPDSVGQHFFNFQSFSTFAGCRCQKALERLDSFSAVIRVVT